MFLHWCTCVAVVALVYLHWLPEKRLRRIDADSIRCNHPNKGHDECLPSLSTELLSSSCQCQDRLVNCLLLQRRTNSAVMTNILLRSMLLRLPRQKEDFVASKTGRDRVLVLCQAFTLKLALAELRYTYKAASRVLPLCTNLCVKKSSVTARN